MKWKFTSRAWLAFVALTAVAASAGAQAIPSRIADSTYWRMITELSEPDGFFRSDNLVGNESSLQWVIPTLQKELGTGGVYLGVAPDQNFTYMIALRPSVVFIVDIRRGAMLQHLLYKALFELSDDRASFLSLLFSRPKPAGLDANSTIDALLAAYTPVAADSALYTRNFAALRRHLGALGRRGQVGRRGDDQNLADAGEHQHRQRIIDHRLVVDRHELLAHGDGQGVEARSRSTGQDNSFAIHGYS